MRSPSSVDEVIPPTASRRLLPLSLLVFLIASILAICWKEQSILNWATATFDIQVQLELQWGQIILVVLVSSAAMSYTAARLWVQKALHPRRTGGNVEITTATAEFFDKLAVTDDRSVADDFQRMERISRLPEHRDQIETSLIAMTPESRVFASFARISTQISVEEFHELYSEYIEWIHLDCGEILYRRGDILGDNGMYMVIEGSVSSYRENTSTPFQRFQSGDLVGDLSMLSNCPRFATTKADNKVELIHISRRMFLALVRQHPAWVLSFIRTSVSRNWYIAEFVLRDFLQIPDGGIRQDRVSAFFAPNSPGAELFEKLDSSFESLELSSGQLVYDPSTTKRFIYVLKKGRVCLTPRPLISDGRAGVESYSPHQSVEIGVGSVFGGASFVTSCSHQESARCLTPCSVALISASCFMSGPDAGIVDLLMSICEDLICPVLRQFEELTFERHWVPAGKLLFKSGDPADECYILVSGRLRIFSLRPDGTPKTLLEAVRGESVGELTLLSGDETHSFNCISVRDCEIVRIPLQAFIDLQVRYPHCLKRFTTIIARRLREVSKTSSAHGASFAKISTIAIMPTGPDVAINAFVDRLAESLRFYGSTLHVNREMMFEKAAENGHVDSGTNLDNDERLLRARVTHALNDLEETNDVLIFSLPNSLSTSWSRCFVRQADHILLVGDATASPIVGDREQALLWNTGDQNIANRDLVLLHNDDVKLPEGTRFWFEGRQVNSHHHIRKNTSTDYGRLARRLSGRAVGLVLGGGGARGLSHMGTMLALHELHVPVDIIGGTSQGAFMAGLFAMHGQIAMEQEVKRFAARMGNVMELLKDATFPIMSYFSGKKFSAAIHDFFRETRIEDLWIPYFCVTTNLTESDIKTHVSGLLWTAVRSSMTVIEYLPPMYVDGAILIDGGYVDNLPVDIMRDRFSPNIVIGVDVENKATAFRNIHDFGNSLSGWWLLWLKIVRMFNPWANHPKVPKFSDIVLALSYINNSRNVRSFLNDKLVDVYIRPELGSVLLLDYHKYEEIRNLGFRQARLIVGRWVIENRRLLSDVRGRALSDVIDRQMHSDADLTSLTLTPKGSMPRQHSVPTLLEADIFILQN